MPCSAALPVPTMIAVGVARPSAQGQAMISTAIAACEREGQRAARARSSSQPTKVSAARTSTAGTK